MAILAAILLGEAFTRANRLGVVLTVIGVVGIVWGAGGTIGTRQKIDYAMFMAAGVL